MSSHRLRAYSILFIVSIIWGIAGVIIKYTLSGFSPVFFLSYRFFLSALVGIPLIFFFRNQIPKDRKVFWESIFYGFLASTVSLGLLFFGTDATSAIDATLISAVAPITIVVAGALFLKEHVTLREKIGIGIAFTGTTVTILEPIIHSQTSFAGLSGNLLVFLSVIVSTATAVHAKILLRKGASPLFLTNISFIVGFVTLTPVALFLYSPESIVKTFVQTGFTYHLGVIYMALLSGIIAYTLWHRAEKTIEVGEVGLIAYLYPVFGTPLAILWLKETVNFPFIVGAIIIALGVLLAEVKIKKREKRVLTPSGSGGNLAFPGRESRGYINYWARLKRD